MDVILITLGVLGFGAILISVYVFTVAARHSVSDEHLNQKRGSDTASNTRVERNPQDRRSNQPVQFPLTAQGALITEDRRKLPDRRRAMAA